MPIIGTELNVLSIAGADFKKIPAGKKVMLRLFLNSHDQFTLAAWVGNNTTYDSGKPLRLLDIDVLSGFKIQGDFLMGDQKIDGHTIKLVKDELKKDPAYLVFFKPMDDTTYHDQLAYEILVGDSSSLKNFTATSFGLTKPSPPYNSKV